MRTDTGLMERAREAMQIPQLESQLQDLDERLDLIRSSVIPDDHFVNTLTAEVLSGGLADDVTARIAQHTNDNRDGARQAEVLTWVRENVVGALEQRERVAVDDGLAVVRRELEVVLSNAEGVIHDLDRGGAVVRSAQDAIDLDRVPAWDQATRLAGRYRECRHVQEELAEQGRKQPGGGVRVQAYGYIRHPDQHGDVRAFVAEHNAPRHAHPITGQALEPTTLPWLNPDPLEQLRFVLRVDVEPWCPSMGELRSEEAKVAERAKAANADDANQEGVQVTAGYDTPLWIRPPSAWSRARAAGKSGG